MSHLTPHRGVRVRPFINISDPGNVVFNFTRDPIGDLTAYAFGYKEAAKLLVAEFSRSSPRPDYEGYPILYLYRHSLELYLKAIVYRSARLLGLMGKDKPDLTRLFTRHELAPLIPAVRAVFDAMQWSFEFEGSEFVSFNEFEQFIEDIDSLDGRSHAFRYPVNRDGRANLREHYVLNVISFATIMDALLDFLEGAADLIEWNFEVIARAEYEIQQYLARDGER